MHDIVGLGARAQYLLVRIAALIADDDGLKAQLQIGIEKLKEDVIIHKGKLSIHDSIIARNLENVNSICLKLAKTNEKK